jgi:hypothetical protein
MKAQFMLERLVPILAHDEKLVTPTILELRMADLCMIIYKILNFGAKFEEKQKPIPLYKRLWIVL